MTPEKLKRLADSQNPDTSKSQNPDISKSLPLESPGLARSLAAGDAGFYPNVDADRPATNDAISTFLDTYGHGNDPREDALIERLIFNPQPDYTDILQEEAADTRPVAGDDSQIDAITRFLEERLPQRQVAAAAAPKAPVATPIKAKKGAVTDANASLQESMAKMLIAQGQYEKARDLLANLHNSRKNRYFALQMQFLDRLIALKKEC